MSNTSSLKLVKSFNPVQYPHELSITFNYDPLMSKGDALFRHDAEWYMDFKLWVMPRDKFEEFKRGLNGLNIDDYFIFNKATTISMHFKDLYEHQMAMAMAIPEGKYKLALIPCEKDTPDVRLQRIAEQARQAFKETASGQISFVVDPKRRSVWAEAQNGWDFIQFLQEHRKLKYQPA